MLLRVWFAALLVAPQSLSLQESRPMSYPESKKVDRVDDYFGTKIADPYRWLEDLDGAETAGWVEAQNRVTFAYLESIPERGRIKERLTALWDYERYGLPSKEGGRYVFSKNDGLQNQAVLYSAATLDDEPSILLDPNRLSSDGTVALTDTVFSDDGRWMAYATSASGSDWKEWRVREVATAADQPDLVKWSKFSGAAWLKDGSGFFYGRYQAPTPGQALAGVNKDQKVYFHRLGTAQDRDELVFARPDHPEWIFDVAVTEDGPLPARSRRAKAPSRRTGCSSATCRSRARRSSRFSIASTPDTRIVGNDGDRFYVLTDESAPRKRLVAIDRASPAPQPGRIDHCRAAWPRRARRCHHGRPIAFSPVSRTDAHDRLRMHRLDGFDRARRRAARPGQPRGRQRSASRRESFYAFASYTSPTTIFRLDREGARARSFASRRSAFDPRQTTRRGKSSTSSKDGTRIPMFIVPSEGSRPRRPESDVSLRLWRVRCLTDTRVLACRDRVARDGRGLRRREPARRRRVRQGVARRRAPGEQAERLRRFHRRRRVPDPRSATPRRPSSRSAAAATAACSSERC